MSMAERIRRGNIVRTEWTGERNVGCYLGNGRFGAIMSSTGLNLSPEQEKDPVRNRSHFRHISHWGRFNLISPHTGKETSADYLLPLFRLHWEREYENLSGYRQCHDLYDGVLNTCFQPEGCGRLRITSWFDTGRKNLSGMTIEASEGEIPDNRICLSVLTRFNPWGFMCVKEYDQTVCIRQAGGEWIVTAFCEDTVNQAKTEIHIATDMAVEQYETGLWFRLHGGSNSLLISIGEPIGCEQAEHSLLRTKEDNHRLWENIGWLDYGQEQMHAVWVRSMAYLLSAYDAESEYIQPVSCMGINGFPYNFIPDISNIAPSLLMLGKWDIVAHWVEKMAGQIEDMKKYARFLWPEAEGIFPPWELNYGPMEGYHAPNAPMIFFYESHNTGYLAKMAMQALEHSGDEVWNQKYALPLIDECARFFCKFCHKEEDGLWHLTWYPCMGRDEAGGVNKDDYLCTLITAKYTFRSAIACGLDRNGDYARILSDGLAFASLMSERGTLHTCRGADDFGRQKHPVQLEGIACFPTEPGALPEEVAAFHLRHDITMDAREPKFWGWTLAQLLMVGTNLGNYEEWRSDWNLIRKSDYTDEMWIQFYESSSVYKSAFYTANHGMVLQSLIRNCVNDYWGKLEIGACLAKDACVSFGDIRTRLGVSVSGKVENGRAAGSIKALRDTDFEFRNQKIHMNQGEEMAFDFAV